MSKHNNYDAQLRISQLVWFALMCSSIVYGYVLYISNKFNLKAIQIDSVVISISSVAFILPILGLALSRKLMKNASQIQELLAAQIIGWILAESAVVMGLVIGLLKGSATFYLVYLIYALIFFVKLKPTKNQLAEFDKNLTL